MRLTRKSAGRRLAILPTRAHGVARLNESEKLSEQSGRSDPKANMKMTFNVERDEENGWLTASWDAPRGQGGIKHSGKDLRELE